MLNPLTVRGIAAALLVLANACAWTAFVVEGRARRREESLERDVLSLWDETDALHARVDQLEGLVRDNAAVCDDDRVRCKARHAAVNPSPRHARRDFVSPARTAALALPAAPSVRDAIDPAWNGGTSTYDALLTKFAAIEDTSALWVPPVERAVVPLHGRDETTEIPAIDVTGELVAQ